MKYMLLLFNEEPQGPPDPAALAAEMPQWQAFGENAAKVATQVAAAALQPSATATVVSVRDGKRITTDGPFVETKEQLGGFYVFDCSDLDVALDLASKIPWAPTGHIEVRPVMEFD
jgi:hypothetical protein